MENYTREYLGIWLEKTPREIFLEELAAEYHNNTEEYDRKVCSGPVVRGSIMPANPNERSAINKNARMELERLKEKAADLRFSTKELMSAISRYRWRR